jgi:hypothetical protein
VREQRFLVYPGTVSAAAFLCCLRALDFERCLMGLRSGVIERQETKDVAQRSWNQTIFAFDSRQRSKGMSFAATRLQIMRINGIEDGKPARCQYDDAVAATESQKRGQQRKLTWP